MEDIQQPLTTDPFAGPPATYDKKKILLIAGAVIFVLILFSLMFLLSSRNAGNKTGGGDEPFQNGNTKISPNNLTATPSVPLGPEKAAQAFYDWYVSHPSPLTYGAYKEREDITPDFKENMSRFVAIGIKPQYDHVFNCGFTPPKETVMLPASFEDDQRLAVVVVKSATSEQNLFQIKLTRPEDSWLVDDVWCMP